MWCVSVLGVRVSVRVCVSVWAAGLLVRLHIQIEIESV